MKDGTADGGPAFPGSIHYPGDQPRTLYTHGMSLRAYVATEAMGALVRHPGLDPKKLARCAAEYADALIAELERG